MCIDCRMAGLGGAMAERIWYCQDKEKFTSFIYWTDVAEQLNKIAHRVAEEENEEISSICKKIVDFVDKNRKALKEDYDEPWKNPNLVPIIKSELFNFSGSI